MKYQSEIIKEIIDTRGHEKSSLHYESECIESWINENKGSYPKLCDYQSEWLNYINENPLGEFPYETLTDITTATVNNVVPYEYKSAILKGNTGLSTDEYDVYWSSNGFIPSNGYKVACDKLSYSHPTTANTFRVNDSGGVFIGVSKGVNITNYLSQNTPKIQYSLTEKSVKTVDLTVVNQDGTELSKIKPIEGTMHITTSGTPINPLFSGEIPVEAIIQNLNSFIRE